MSMEPIFSVSLSDPSLLVGNLRWDWRIEMPSGGLFSVPAVGRGLPNWAAGGAITRRGAQRAARRWWRKYAGAVAARTTESEAVEPESAPEWPSRDDEDTAVYPSEAPTDPKWPFRGDTA